MTLKLTTQKLLDQRFINLTEQIAHFFMTKKCRIKNQKTKIKNHIGEKNVQLTS